MTCKQNELYVLNRTVNLRHQHDAQGCKGMRNCSRIKLTCEENTSTSSINQKGITQEKSKLLIPFREKGCKVLFSCHHFEHLHRLTAKK